MRNPTQTHIILLFPPPLRASTTYMEYFDNPIPLLNAVQIRLLDLLLVPLYASIFVWFVLATTQRSLQALQNNIARC